MQTKPTRILLVEDNPGDARLIREMLLEADGHEFDITWATRLSQGLESLSRSEADLVLLDLGLPDSMGLDTFVEAYAHSPAMPFVILTGLADETIALAAVGLGAQDYLIKGEVDGKLLLRAIRYATERKKIELALEAERKKLYSLLNSLPALVHLKGADFTIQFANRHFTEVFGEPGNRRCYEILTGRSEPCEHCRALEVLTTKAPQKHEWTSSVNARTYEVYNYPFCYEEDLLVLTLGIDITERKRAEEALRESEERFRTIFEGAAIGISLRDANARLIACNPAYQEMFGYSEEELRSKSFMEIIHPDDVKGTLGLFREMFIGKHDCGQIEKRCRHKNGNYFWGRVTFTLTKGLQGEPLYCIGMVEDITGRKEAEESIHHLTHELMRTQEQEKHKISLELHDTVAQELAALKLGLENLQGDLPGKPVGELNSRLMEFSEIVQKVLNWVRALSYDLRPTVLEHFGLVQAIKLHCEEFTARNGIKVDFRTAGMEAASLGYDAAITLYRIIQEGLTNVWRHSQAKNVRIRLVASFPKIILRLEDDGQGFDVSGQKTSMTQTKHMGLLGMRERVSLLGGKMSIESQLMKGTKITVEIPWNGDGLDSQEEAHHS